jgi:hypothetical protein
MLIQRGYVKASFADALKDAVSTIFGWERSLLEGDTDESRTFRECVDPWWSKRFGYDVTPRLMLQRFGTEACREGLHRDIWVYALEKSIEGIKDVVIPDVRFPNELLYIYQHNGKTVKIIRGKQPTSEELKNLHESERAIAAYRFDYVIDNNGTLEDLRGSVDSLLTFPESNSKLIDRHI